MKVLHLHHVSRLKMHVVNVAAVVVASPFYIKKIKLIFNSKHETISLNRTLCVCNTNTQFHRVGLKFFFLFFLDVVVTTFYLIQYDSNQLYMCSISTNHTWAINLLHSISTIKPQSKSNLKVHFIFERNHF